MEHTMNNAHRSSDASAAPGVGARVEELSGSAQKFFSDARSAVKDLSESVSLTARVHRHPYGMVAAAIGVGYLLGGGLFTPLSGRLFKLGVRLAALPFVKEELVGIAEAALNGLTQSGQSASPSSAAGAAGSASWSPPSH